MNVLLKPIQSVKESNSRLSIDSENISEDLEKIEKVKLNDNKEKEILSHATKNLTDAVRGMIIIVRLLSKQAIQDKRKGKADEYDSNLYSVYDGIFIV